MAMTLTLPSCSDDDPGITNIKLCESIPSGENECEDDTDTIASTNPTINISCDLEGVEENDSVNFTLSLDSNGSLTEVSSLNTQLDGSGNSGTAFATFTLPANTVWGEGSWEIEIELETEIPVTATKRFTTI